MALAFAATQPAIKTRLFTHENNKYSLIIEPLLPGYGHTLGNPMRRVLLSSIPGFGITKVKVNNATHEYQALPGVMEDTLDVVLNLKMLRAQILNDDEKVTLTLTKEGPGEIYASDFEQNGKGRIVNTDLYICSLDKGGKLHIEVEISRGVGYLPVEKINLANNLNPQDILVDTVFSPVADVAMEVEQMRVGDMTNYDKLSINFRTDGTVSGEEVANYLLDFMTDMFEKIRSSFQASSVNLTSAAPAAALTTAKAKVGSIDEITLPKRLKDILEKQGITTNSELKNKLDEVKDFAGINEEKDLPAIEEYLNGLK